MYRLPSWMHWKTITGRILIGVVLACVRRRVVGDRVGDRATVRSSTTTSPSISSTDRSAASRAARCCVRSAARCRPTGCSRRCRRSALTGCPAATRRSGSSSSRARTCRSASRGGAGSGSIRSDSTARSAIPAPCATPPARRPASCSACRRTSSICRRLVEFVLECSLDNRMTRGERAPARFRELAAAVRRCSSGCCSGSGWWIG